MTETKLEALSNGDNNEAAPKEKIRNIMEAASALTALGDEESDSSRPCSPKASTAVKGEESNSADDGKDDNDDSKKRFLPDHKKPDAAPTFPEKLMSMMRYTLKQDESFCITWCEDGKSFIIRNPDEFTRHVVPKFFKATKFSSFTRKLYRWGFRQINRGIGPDDPIIFGNEYFQRDDESLIAKMRSVTAASTRKQEQGRMTVIGAMKRPFDDPFDDDNQKRMLFDQLLHQQKQMNMMNPNQYYGGMNPNGSIPLSNALRPNLGYGQGPNPGMPQMGNMMMQHQGPGNQNHGMMMNQMNPQYMQQGAPMGNNQYNPNPPQYPNTQSTAEIVNAAIAALRHAN